VRRRGICYGGNAGRREPGAASAEPQLAARKAYAQSSGSMAEKAGRWQKGEPAIVGNHIQPNSARVPQAATRRVYSVMRTVARQQVSSVMVSGAEPAAYSVVMVCEQRNQAYPQRIRRTRRCRTNQYARICGSAKGSIEPERGEKARRL